MMKISVMNLSTIINNITSRKTLMILNGIKATKCFIIIHIKITIIKGIARIPSIKRNSTKHASKNSLNNVYNI